jgi:hypothetical protein
MTSAELFALIADALVDLDINQETEQGKRIYLAYLASRIGQGQNGPLERRLAQLRKEINI